MAKECQRRPFEAQKHPVHSFWKRNIPADWLIRSWPWWLASGILLVPFTERLRLLEWLLFFLILVVVHVIRRENRLLIRVALLVVSGILWGSLWGDVKLSAGMPDDLAGRDAWVTGTVVSLPEKRSRALRFRFKSDTLEHEELSRPYTHTLLVNWYQPWPALEPGQRWRLKLRMKPAHGSLNPGAFNYEQWLFSQGIAVTAYVREADRAVLLETRGGVYAVERFRARVQHIIQAQGLNNGGVLTALATGVRSDISDAQWKVFRRTGTAHLVAISGLHIGMVAAMGYFVGFRLWRRFALVLTHYPAQSVARLVSLLMAVMYAALAGFALPTTRALLMLVTYYALQWLRRNPGPFFSLGLVMLSVLLLDPLAPLSGGFWLSFGAVFAIMMAVRNRDVDSVKSDVPGTTPRLGAVLMKRLILWWRVQLAVFLGLFPLTLFLFQQVPLVSLPANAIAIPVVTLLVVPLVLLALLALILNIPVAAASLLGLADTLLGWLWQLLQPLSDGSLAVIRPPIPQSWEVLVAVLALLLIFLPTLGRARYLGMLGLVPLFFCTAPLLRTGAYQVEVLDVGQGLAVVVRTRDHALLYDAGVRYPSGFDAGSAIVLPFLRQQGVPALDAVVVSHDNLDHAGGFESVLAEFPEAARYASAAFYPESSACLAGQGWEWDGVAFEFLHPQPGSTGSANNDSCVLRIEGQYGSVLLSGDIEKKAEYQMQLDVSDELRDVDVLLIPHHGSRTSSTAGFLNKVDPRLSVVSAGYLNRFGHPHPDVVRHYAERGIPLLNTADGGWINIRIDADGIQATPYRAVYRRYWLNARPGEALDRVVLPGHRHDSK